MMATNPLAGRDVLRLLDLAPEEVQLVLDTAARQKDDWNSGIREYPQQGKSVAVILEKPSLRTRTSFEVAAFRLGAHPVVMDDDRSAFSRGETVQDTTLVLERFVDCIVMRTFGQSRIEEVARWAGIPVVNALTDDYHPCQVLADLLTIREHKGALKGRSIAYVGDGNNMANTYLEGAVLTGMDIRIATPPAFACSQRIVDECLQVAERTGSQVLITTDPHASLEGADVVITDTWTSMGDEDEHDLRLAAFSGYQIDAKAMSYAADDAIFMHCLPAHRGEEVADEVMDGPWSVIYDEAENRLHAQKALLSLVMG